jgi:hypothetical protein
MAKNVTCKYRITARVKADTNYELEVIKENLIRAGANILHPEPNQENARHVLRRKIGTAVGQPTTPAPCLAMELDGGDLVWFASGPRTIVSGPNQFQTTERPAPPRFAHT